MNAAPPKDEPEADAGARAFRSKPVLAVLTLLSVAVVLELVPALSRYRLLSPRPIVSAEPPTILPPETTLGEAELPSTTDSRPDLAQPEKLEERLDRRGPIADEGETLAQHGATDVSPVPIVDESKSLSHLFSALRKTERGEKSALSRIVFFGDSVVASDFGTGTLRRLLQKRFGDAGHGFVLAASAWPQYFHNDVYRYADKGFRASRVVGPRASDGLYGLGGVSFVGAPGLRSRVGTSKSGSYGRRVSRFEIAWAKEPGGGVLELSVDGVPHSKVDTEAATTEATFTEIRVPDGEHELELRTARGNVRLFGVVLERDEPGVVLDAIGLVGARLRTLDESDDADFAHALAWRKPNLVAYQFGANESGDGFAYPMPEYHRTMTELIRKVQRAVPDAGCLVVGAMDRARKEDGHLVTLPIIPRLVEEQRKVAAEVGCAFYATYDAMGGRGSMGAWVKKGFGAGDFTHPTSWGADQLGRWIYSALMTGYDAYRAGTR